MAMTHHFQQQDGVTAAIANPSHHSDSPPQNMNIDGEDFISSLPEAILHLILSYIPTKAAIKTSVLSKRWRYVWSGTPCLFFETHRFYPNSISKTLSFFSAPTITSFHLRSSLHNRIDSVNSWIEFAISHHSKNLSLEFRDNRVRNYKFPDFFFTNSSVNQLLLSSGSIILIPKCKVSWTSLKELSLSFCILSDESLRQILSGSPLLESLELLYCSDFRRLDLSQSRRLRKLDMDRSDWFLGPTFIVAPHIHSLRLRQSRLQCTLVDVSSLTEADLNVYFSNLGDYKTNFLQRSVVKMLEKFQNVEKLTIGGTFLQMLSLAALCNVSFPKLKVKDLTLQTMIIRSVIPGIIQLLQKSPGLRKLTVHTVKCSSIAEVYLNDYLCLHSSEKRQCWRSKDAFFPSSLEAVSMLVGNHAEANLVALFMELLLKNTSNLDTMVVLLVGYLDASSFEELLAMAKELSHKYNNVNIVIKPSKVKNVPNSTFSQW
ncbi:F-box/LRR-repeat protein [Cardamine amara subsp. amara]|uniref:F-box/LRR-repeat protein n=1 Tax=Cardamine amara subsp. amara TaxID=228776 RepID=A0ABD1AK75_CARAN